MTTTPVISEVLQAGLIVHVRLVAENLSAWQPEDAGQRRTGTLTVEVVEILKGRLAVGPGASVEVQIVERGSAGGLVLDYYGIWAPVSTTPGTQLVGFCDGSSTDLADQLTDEHCTQLLPAAATVLDDLHLALGLNVGRLTADQLIDEASRLRARGGARFARYVWVNVRNAVLASTDRFDALMRIAEDPTTTTAAQEAYLMAAYEDATVTAEWPASSRARLARAMFRAALDPATPELRDPMLGTFVPNLIGAQAPEALSAQEVFADRADLEEQVRSATEAAHLRGWLGGGA
ncbi:hypothetical protein [Actinopolymorpha alba]|uniref:hypothetical protein n=1 Tax=Actinopolymorpha alba TaxID=533267 RepID=UPI0003605D90|nr:hypothetical protein [Actinopolymorpha alba]